MTTCTTSSLNTVEEKVAKADWPFLLRHFEPHEFNCPDKCGLGFAEMRIRFLLKLDCARQDAGIPFIISSAMRCKAHNQEVGGVHDSAHLHGWAVDIRIPDSRTRFKVMKSLHKVGFNRFGLYPHIPHMLHVDCMPGKDSDVIWYRINRIKV